MDPEEKKKDDSNEFGKVIDVLHSKQKLPSLRTYQGDMAEFIKSKDQSVISVALKEKEKKEKDLSLPQKSIIKEEGFKINLVTLSLSILLLACGAVALMYIFDFLKREPTTEVAIETEIISYNNLITLANLTSENFRFEFIKLSPASGINIVTISDTNGVSFKKAKDFFDFLKISLPPALERTLKNDYVIGIISQNEEKSSFIVITVNDFGQAFAAMLVWEENMEKDLAFLNKDKSDPLVSSSNTIIATSTATTTIEKIPKRLEIFNWKDLIIKNKDTRGLVNEKGQSKIAYTFLDKNTILITNNLSAVGNISAAYASRSVAR